LAEKLIEKIAEKALPIVQGAGYDLADAELVKEGANWFLRFFIERPDPDEAVTTDDCQKVSERLSEWLDEADPIPHAYFLEVSSPGIERALKTEKDFKRFQGRMVQVTAYAPIDGAKTHLGTLGAVTESELSIWQDGRDVKLAREKIASVRLHWDEDGV
jgi:ribosome maturation factor RimP